MTNNLIRLYLPLIFFFFSVCVSAQTSTIESKDSLINVNTYRFADTLSLDLYRPVTPRSEAPLLLLVHGGGFYTGSRDGEREMRFAKTMALSGFPVASISYRLSRKGKPEGFGCQCPAREKIETFKMAVEDVSSAIRVLTENKSDWGLGNETFVLVGSSAGAEAILQYVLMKNHPAFKGMADPKGKVAGLISFAGAVLDTSYIDEADAVPALLFHGTDDKLVPFGSAPHHFCDDSAPGYLPLYGSAAIADSYRKLGSTFILVKVKGGGHEWANLAYEQTDLITRFLEEYVISEQRYPEVIGKTTR
ncbi:alpha/beta hydrolase [Robertkochia aurantiaca]|uniref:alpha/beta hydrolase n=1 Tax=Robertkochia aurantiaca TaxID=2873700 RepID=UPI001CC91661|nr:alpha/beta hydrolase [Robertkochia sp. 3YJGBD-33]